MDYRICINKEKIRSINAPKIERAKVHSYIDIDEGLLAEKDGWYIIDKKYVVFFKARDDHRLAGECISQVILEEAGFASAQYEIVCLNKKIGLLTPNFQDLTNYSYYDLYNLHKLFPALNTNYNNISFKAILEMISYQDFEGKEELIQELIDRYVGEWVTHQTDGNPRNAMVAKSKINGRLNVAPSFDREKCFGIDKNGYFNLKDATNIWVPAIPYSDLGFRTNPYTFDDGIDFNILELFMDYPEQTARAFSRLFSVNYNELFNSFAQGKRQFALDNHTINYLCDIIDSKDSQKRKILSLKG